MSNEQEANRSAGVEALDQERRDLYEECRATQLVIFLQYLIQRCEHGDIDETCEDQDWRRIYISAKKMLKANTPLTPAERARWRFLAIEARHAGDVGGPVFWDAWDTEFDALSATVVDQSTPPLLASAVASTPRAIWLTLTDILDLDNGYTHNWTAADMCEAIPAIVELQKLGFFADKPNDLDGSFWQCASGEDTERREFFARGIEHLDALDKVINRIFDPEPAPAKLPPWWNKFIVNICDLPDRNSPEDEPLAMIATADELEACALNAMEGERGS